MNEKVPAQGGSASGGKNKIFAYSILGLNVIAAWISWWVLADALSGESAHPWLYPILAFSFWGMAFTLSAIFVKKKIYLHPCYLASGLGYLIFFQPGWPWLAALLSTLLLVFAERRIKKEIERGIKIDFYHLVSHALKFFVTIVCLVIAVTYYFSIRESSNPSPTLLERKTLETEMEWGLKTAGFVLPEDKKEMITEINNDITVDEFLSKNFVEPQFGNASRMTNAAIDATKLIGDAATLEIQKQILDKTKSDLAKQLGVNVVGEQMMKEVLMAYIEKTQKSFFEYSNSEKFYIPIILAFGLFLTARVLGTAIDIFLGLFILGIIKILRVSGVVQVGAEQKEVAMIEYSI